MPTTFSDQFWSINAFNPPAPGTALPVSRFNITDQNDNGVISRFNGDAIDGVDIGQSYPGDTITVTLEGGGQQTFTGTTFYLADGRRLFTPTDGSTLPQNATFLSSTASPTEAGITTAAFGPPCFTMGTMIATPEGKVAIEHLAAGDDVLVEADGTMVARSIRWAGRRNYGAAALQREPRLRPVRILAGALGDGLPQQDLLVSRQHRVLVKSKIAQRMFGAPEVLVAAIRLTELPGIFVDDEVSEVTYLHLLFDQHEIIVAEGVSTESLYTGPEALQAIGPEARAEILMIFPELARLDYQPQPARHIPHLRQQKKLIERHAKNNRTLQGVA